MTTVYLDSVFLVNAIIDYLLCLLTARLSGITLRRGRYLAAAMLGGGYAAAVFLPGWSFLAQMPTKLAAGILMTLIAYGGKVCFLRVTILWFGLSCVMAGSVLALGLLVAGSAPMAGGVFYLHIGGGRLLLIAAVLYGAVTFVFQAAAKHGVRGELLPVRLCIGGKTAELTALWDSGNTLRDPLDGLPVLVVAADALGPCFSRNVLRQLQQLSEDPVRQVAMLAEAVPELRPGLLSYHAVGIESGLLPAIRAEWAEIGGIRHQNMTIALTQTGLGSGYQALWGGEVRKEGTHVCVEHPAAVAEASAGADKTHSLYRRKRYAAAAIDPGTGGPAAGAAGGGGRPQRADRT